MFRPYVLVLLGLVTFVSFHTSSPPAQSVLAQDSSSRGSSGVVAVAKKVDGIVGIRKDNSSRFVPLRENQLIHMRDLIYPGRDSRVVVKCAGSDNSRYSRVILPSGVTSGITNVCGKSFRNINGAL